MIDSSMVRPGRSLALGSRCGWAGSLAKWLALAVVSGTVCCAQQAADEPSPSTTLASEFFDHDFVNVFAFGNAIYDTALPQLTASGSSYGGSWGYDVGGGLTVGHNFKDGTFSLSYKGDYRHYDSTTYSSGTNQNLSLLYSKRLSRHWSMNLQGGGGIVSYGGEFFTAEAAGAGASVLTNPFSSQSRFANANVSLTYEQTRRLSYTFSGAFFYSSYNYAGAIESKGGSGTAAVNYRTTARTTIGASYSRTYFDYSGTFGSTSIDAGYLNASHLFSGHWTVSGSAGISHSHAQGTITEPITVLLGQQLVSGYITGPFNRTNNSPSFQLTLARTLRRSAFSVSGGQGINAGNGTYLTARDQYVNATYSLTHHLQNLSFGGGWTQLESIANTVSSKYSSSNASVSYGFNLVRYVSANIRYDFIHYDNLYQLKGVNESRFTFGLTFSSKSIPLTLF